MGERPARLAISRRLEPSWMDEIEDVTVDVVHRGCVNTRSLGHIKVSLDRAGITGGRKRLPDGTLGRVGAPLGRLADQETRGLTKVKK